ncbi:leucine-rich repeat domain-containing protein [Roseivirga sp. BDSF3-8]|uniref:leucine-rich repeat domain-containing protein n=1 Tax=Roseivirga sp. BDSF3-8 TaxID=3241598 RepID=UPI00353225EA
MRIKALGYLFVFFLVGMAYPAEARQDDKALSPEQQEAYQENARELVAFYEYMMNLLGDPLTATSDKQTIIANSYAKAFRDEEVQVEDDLAENRSVATYKDVQAYLQDIDFFFESATFDVEVTKVEPLVSDEGQLAFKVSAVRTLNAVTNKGDSVSNSRERFIELNLDPESSDLRIVSVYTSPLNKKEELYKWWNGLSYAWQEIFRRQANIISDTLGYDQLQEVAGLKRLDISDNGLIISLEPLQQLSELEDLNVARTQISDLTPIRNLTSLKQLTISGTPVSTLDPLRYTSGLERLIADSTNLKNASELTQFPKLQRLSVGYTPLDSLAPLQKLNQLTDLRLANVPAVAFDFLSQLNKLEVLDASYTELASLEPLSAAKNLRILIIDSTRVASLSPLDGLEKVERIYCDNTGISREDAETFMNSHEGTLVVSGIRQIENWWNMLVDDWRAVFREATGLQGEPTREDLAQMVNLTQLTISPEKQLWTLKPLEVMHRLRSLDAEGQTFYSIEPLRGLTDLHYLNLSRTKIASLDPLNTHTGLRYLNISYTPITSLSPVMDIAMDTIIADSTGIDPTVVAAYYDRYPNALIIYRTPSLQKWWTGLSNEWKEALRGQSNVTAFEQDERYDSLPSARWLHQLLKLEEINIQEQSRLGMLSPLEMLDRLQRVTIVRSGVTNLDFAARLPRLTYLDVSANPLQRLAPLKNADSLRVLKVANTAVEELEALENHPSLEVLDCSGTPIKRIDELENVRTLTRLDISNTRVRRLNDLEELPNLIMLKCFNTRISSGEVEDFRESQPEAEVIYY